MPSRPSCFSFFNTLPKTVFRFAYPVDSVTNATGWLPGRQIMESSQPPIDHGLDGQSKVPEIIAVLTVCTVLSTGLVTMRSYSRAYISGGFGADDWALVAAQVCAPVPLPNHYRLLSIFLLTHS